MVVISLGGRRSVAVAACIVSATLALSMFPTNTVSVVADAGSLNGADGTKCVQENSSCGEIIMLEDFASPKHNWVEMNDPGKCN